MELQSMASVKAGAKQFKKQSEQLNVLVNNAGIAMTPYGLTRDGFEQQFGVNHLAHFYLFQLLKPLLLASSTPTFNSRVVSVSSLAHTMGSMIPGDYSVQKQGYNPIAGYGNFKTANIWFANEAERRYASQGLHALSLHPGAIGTGLARSHDEESKRMVDQMIDASPHIQNSFMNVEQGAASTVLAALGKDYEGVGGFYMEDCAKSVPMAKDAPLGSPGYAPWAYDEEGARRLWIESLGMLGLEDNQK